MKAKAILNLIPTMQSTAILSENIKLAKKPKKKVGDFVGVGVKNIIGIELQKETSNIIGSIK
jgi:hypothetical protein